MRKTVFILSLLLIFSLFIPVMAQDAEPEIFTTDDWAYKANDSGWLITDYLGNETDIEIPADFDEIPVTALADELFMNLIQLERVVIPEQVSAIGKNAFNGCASLKEVILPLQIKTIPEGCFRYCTSLENIILPNTLTSIGKNAFADCVKLNEIIIPSNVTTVGESAFDNCQSLATIYASRKLATVNANAFADTAWLNAQTDEFVFIGRGILLQYNGFDANVEIPYGTVAIANAFQDNSLVESVVIPETVIRIMQNAFLDCVNLTEITIPDSVTSIAANAFQNCRSLTQIKLPESITSIGANAFNGCERLTDLTFPSKVTNIQNGVARDCPALTSAHIPAGVTAFHKNAFLNSENVDIQIAKGSAVEAILVENEIPYSYYLDESDGFVYWPTDNGIEIVKYNGILYDVEIPAEIIGVQVTSIGTAAFQNNSSVRSVTVPLTVRKIGDWAFSYMDSLQTIWLPAGLESIGANVFTGASSLLEIRFSNALEEVGKYPFDLDNTPKICAHEGSAAETLLTEMGYLVSPYEACANDPANAALWTEYSYMALAPVECETASTPIYYSSTSEETLAIVRIPDETETLTVDLLAGSGLNIIIVIPSNVKAIDPAILTGRTVRLIVDAGSYAETFAKENDASYEIRGITVINY